jgi:hypothetical protein
VRGFSMLVGDVNDTKSILLHVGTSQWDQR